MAQAARNLPPPLPREARPQPPPAPSARQKSLAPESGIEAANVDDLLASTKPVTLESDFIEPDGDPQVARRTTQRSIPDAEAAPIAAPRAPARPPAGPPRPQHVVLAETEEALKLSFQQLLADAKRELDGAKDEHLAELGDECKEAKRLVSILKAGTDASIRKNEERQTELKKDIGGVVRLEGTIKDLGENVATLRQSMTAATNLLTNSMEQAKHASSETSQVTKLGGQAQTAIGEMNTKLSEMEHMYQKLSAEREATLKAAKRYQPKTSVWAILNFLMTIAICIAWSLGIDSPLNGLFHSSKEAPTDALPAMGAPSTSAKPTTTAAPASTTPAPRTESVPALTVAECGNKGGKILQNVNPDDIKLDDETQRYERTVGNKVYSCSKEGRQKIPGTIYDCLFECSSRPVQEEAPEESPTQ